VFCARAAASVVFDMTTSQGTEESDYHNVVERLRDPSHTSALPLSELVQLLGLVGLQVDKIETIDYDLDVEDWIARAEQSADDAQRARQLIAAAIGTRKFGGKRVWRDEDGKALVQRAMGDPRGDEAILASSARRCSFGVVFGSGSLITGRIRLLD